MTTKDSSPTFAMFVPVCRSTLAARRLPETQALFRETFEEKNPQHHHPAAASSTRPYVVLHTTSMHGRRRHVLPP